MLMLYTKAFGTTKKPVICWWYLYYLLSWHNGKMSQIWIVSIVCRFSRKSAFGRQLVIWQNATDFDKPKFLLSCFEIIKYIYSVSKISIHLCFSTFQLPLSPFLSEQILTDYRATIQCYDEISYISFKRHAFCVNFNNEHVWSWTPLTDTIIIRTREMSVWVWFI